MRFSMPPMPAMLYLLDLIGVAVFAVSGVLAAGRAGLDLLADALRLALFAITGARIADAARLSPLIVVLPAP